MFLPRHGEQEQVPTLMEFTCSMKTGIFYILEFQVAIKYNGEKIERGNRE